MLWIKSPSLLSPNLANLSCRVDNSFSTQRQRHEQFATSTNHGISACVSVSYGARSSYYPEPCCSSHHSVVTNGQTLELAAPGCLLVQVRLVLSTIYYLLSTICNYLLITQRLIKSHRRPLQGPSPWWWKLCRRFVASSNLRLTLFAVLGPGRRRRTWLLWSRSRPRPRTVAWTTWWPRTGS